MKIVFISHSSQDKNIAQSVCQVLEKNGIECWIAPRDVRPGYPWDEEIIFGIESTKAMIILLSEDANKSDHVKRELEYAVNNKSAIFPVRIHDIQPSKKLSLWLMPLHWVDIWPPPLNDRLGGLVAILKQYLEITKPEVINKTEESTLKVDGFLNTELHSFNNIDKIRADVLSALKKFNCKYYSTFLWGSEGVEDSGSKAVYQELNAIYNRQEIPIICELLNTEIDPPAVDRKDPKWETWIKLIKFSSYALEVSEENAISQILKSVAPYLKKDKYLQMPILSVMQYLPISTLNKWQYLFQLLDEKNDIANIDLITAITDYTPPVERNNTANKIVEIWSKVQAKSYVGHAAEVTLKKWKSISVLPQLREMLKKSDDEVCTQIIGLMLEWKDQNSLEELKNQIEKRRFGSNSVLISKLCHCVAELHGASVANFLSDVLINAIPDVQNAIISSLEHYHETTFIEAVNKVKSQI